jgi:hypothetical protein
MIKIVYCPTEEMWADYFSKPLNGRLFYKQRDVIMNINPSSPYHSSCRSVLESEDLNEENKVAEKVRPTYADVVKTGSSRKSPVPKE